MQSVSLAEEIRRLEAHLKESLALKESRLQKHIAQINASHLSESTKAKMLEQFTDRKSRIEQMLYA